MDINERKSKLHQLIDNLEDEFSLQQLHEAAEIYATASHDILENLSDEQLKRLEQAQQQIKEGKGVSNEEVQKNAKEWLSK